MALPAPVKVLVLRAAVNASHRLSFDDDDVESRKTHICRTAKKTRLRGEKFIFRTYIEDGKR
jgi:hypothetical protein